MPDFSDYLEGAAIALVLSAAVRALPDPEPSGSKFYLWVFRFSHGILANWDKFKAGGKPDGAN
jgi:hypothetical protein